jgi:hypothetical protein
MFKRERVLLMSQARKFIFYEKQTQGNKIRS